MIHYLAGNCASSINAYGDCLNNCIEKQTKDQVTSCIQQKCTPSAQEMSGCLASIQPQMGVIEKNILQDIGKRCHGADVFDLRDKRELENVQECEDAIIEVLDEYIPGLEYPSRSTTIEYLHAMMRLDMRDS